MFNVKLTCNWCDDYTLCERFTKCYVNKLNYDPYIQFTHSNKYDLLVIIHHPLYNIDFPKEKTIGIVLEPSWTVHHQQKHVLEKLCNHIISYKLENNPQYILYPGLVPYHFDATENDLDYFLQTNFKKTKNCSMVCTYNLDDSPQCLYKKRTEFALQILNTDLDIDIYGNGWERANILDRRIKGSLKNKKDGLRDYKFSIAIENCIEENYFTEKIIDCILTDTTPIYFGCPNIHNYIKTTYTLSNLNSTNELADILKHPTITQDKQILCTKYNLYSAICKYINTTQL